MARQSVEALKRNFGNRYFPNEEMSIAEIPFGQGSENYLVEVGDVKYVLKWYAEADPKDLGEELAALQWLRGRGVPVPAIVPDRNGGLLAEIDGASAVLLEHIAGAAPDDEFATGLQIAEFLSEFHIESSAFIGKFFAQRTELARLKTFAITCKPTHLSIDGLPEFIADYGEEIAQYKVALESGGGAKGLIHHDLHAAISWSPSARSRRSSTSARCTRDR